jgi:hypothetical protein
MTAAAENTEKLRAKKSNPQFFYETFPLYNKSRKI